VSISQKKAEKIALDFLEQYHDASTIESSTLEDEIWVVTAKIGLISQQLRKITIDGRSGQILGYSDSRLDINDYGINQVKVALAIEKALLGIGAPAYEMVVQKLYEDYRCRIFDCYDKPEYLSRIIKDMFGDNYRPIAESIRDNLGDISEQNVIKDFLSVISK
jgi:hypothetical protein